MLYYQCILYMIMLFINAYYMILFFINERYPCREHYMPMCHPKNGTSMVQECQGHPTVPQLPTTSVAKERVENICVHGAHAMEECEQCDWSQSRRKCNYFSLYIQLCKAMPDMEWVLSINRISTINHSSFNNINRFIVL